MTEVKQNSKTEEKSNLSYRSVFNFLNICKNLGMKPEDIDVVINFMQISYKHLIENKEFIYPSLGKFVIIPGIKKGSSINDDSQPYVLSIVNDVIAVCKPEFLFTNYYPKLGINIRKQDILPICRAFKIAVKVIQYENLVQIPGLCIVYSSSKLQSWYTTLSYDSEFGVRYDEKVFLTRSTFEYFDKSYAKIISKLVNKEFSYEDYFKMDMYKNNPFLRPMLSKEINSTSNVFLHKDFTSDQLSRINVKLVYKENNSVFSKEFQNRLYRFSTSDTDYEVHLEPLYPNNNLEYLTANETHQLVIIHNGMPKLKTNKSSSTYPVVGTLSKVLNSLKREPFKILKDISNEPKLEATM